MRFSAGVFVAITVISFFGCGTKAVEINYLGQKPPGMTAELFAPEMLGTNANEHSAVALWRVQVLLLIALSPRYLFNNLIQFNPEIILKSIGYQTGVGCITDTNNHQLL